jgi:uncharacterized protein
MVFVNIVSFMPGNNMKEVSLPNYSELEWALDKTTLKLHPSQVHGLISGILSGNTDGNVAWEELVTGGKDPAKTQEVLQHLYDATSKQLEDFLFEFQVIMPEDEDDLKDRAEALTLWCQGFLTGLKFVNITIVDRKPSEMTEAINDIIEIAKMNYEDVVSSEEDEAAYVELVEFVRLAAILIYQDMREGIKIKKSTSTSNHLH